jgi:hypothetical protein
MDLTYKSFYALAWLILVGLFSLAVGPTIETMFFPVYSKFKQISAVERPDGVLAVFGYVKYRDCEPRGLTWYLGEVGASHAVNVEAREGVRSPRPLGYNRSLPYLIEGVTLEDLEHRIIAQLRNQCYVLGVKLPWLTVSEVYP